ncbi:ribosome recycling factor [Alphaproteobacteria bacterium]|nr:ribosome recycling factor [Alphaproteobacteria bacterium]
MAEPSLTPENLESYSTEAISNFSKAIEDFADVITDIKSEDANIAVFNSIYVMIDGRKRRLADIANVEAPDDPLNLEVMVYSKDNLEIVIDTIKEAGFPSKLKEKNSQFIIVRVPPPSRMQLEEIGDDLIRKTNSLVMRLTKIKTNTGLRIRAAVQNEFIETKIATLATKKIDASHLKIESEGKFLGVLKRKQILGNYFKSSEKDDEMYIKKVNLYLRLNNNMGESEKLIAEKQENEKS